MPVSRLEKEQALQLAGVAMGRYPTLDRQLATADPAAADWLLIAAGNAWDREIDRLYLILLQRQEADRYPGEVSHFIEVCNHLGMRSALQQLNERVPHRYTAAYRLKGDLLVNIELVDKLGKVGPEFLAEVPLGSSFCQYVLRDGSFLTTDSSQDKRLDGHPYQGVMVTYHGVPILDDKGYIFGSLCHFDVTAQSLPDEEFGRLQALAWALSRFVQ